MRIKKCLQCLRKGGRPLLRDEISFMIVKNSLNCLNPTNPRRTKMGKPKAEDTTSWIPSSELRIVRDFAQIMIYSLGYTRRHSISDHWLSPTRFSAERGAPSSADRSFHDDVVAIISIPCLNVRIATQRCQAAALFSEDIPVYTAGAARRARQGWVGS